MVVNSINFWVFFAVFLIPYFFLFRKMMHQNIWLLLASLFFYGWVDWKMVPLLFVVSAFYFFLGIKIEKSNQTSPKKASLFTILGIVAGVGVLFYFKYFNFFVGEFSGLFSAIGIHVNSSDMDIIMPIGVSFFTFKVMSYVIEIHRENIKPTRNPVVFAAYVAFFPTILSGPIDRPTTFLPQFNERRKLDFCNLSEGLKRILWGLFLKMCIADIISSWTDAVFSGYGHHNATTIIAAAVLYTLQLYTDFCGFSEMAIGVGRIMGFTVTENFCRPFFSQNIAEYWRRWHMSLTTWITDYVFMPLNVAFRDWGRNGIFLATLINMVIIGMWHGANWTFFWFGVYHGLMLILIILFEKQRKKMEKKYGLKKKESYIWFRRLLAFVLFAFGSMLFRSASVTDFIGMVKQVGQGFGPIYDEELPAIVVYVLPSVAVMLFREWVAEYKRDIHFFHSPNVYVRLASIALMISTIIYIGQLDGNSFIYFKF